MSFKFEAGRDRQYPSFDFHAGFDRFDLKRKYPEAYANASEGLASSKLNNFAADQGGRILNKIFQDTHFSSAGYSHGGSTVYHSIISHGGPSTRVRYKKLK